LRSDERRDRHVAEASVEDLKYLIRDVATRVCVREQPRQRGRGFLVPPVGSRASAPTGGMPEPYDVAGAMGLFGEGACPTAWRIIRAFVPDQGVMATNGYRAERL